MTSTNDGKDVKSNQTSGHKGKTYYIELYKSLEARLSSPGSAQSRTGHVAEAWRSVHTLCLHSAPSTHTHLLSWLQRHTHTTILQTEWQSPQSKDDRKVLDEAISAFVEECESAVERRDGVAQGWERQLLQRAEWLRANLENPWGHPVLRVLLDPREEQPSEESILEWLREERGSMFVTRLRQLASSKCDDLALTLASSIMDRIRATTVFKPDVELVHSTDKPEQTQESPLRVTLTGTAGFTMDVWELLGDIEFVLLYKLDKRARCIELAKLTPLRGAYQLVERLRCRLETSPREKKLWKNAKDVATLIAQVVIARCMVVPHCTGVVRAALYCSTRALCRVSDAMLPRCAAALAAPAASCHHLHTLAHAAHAQVGDNMKPFVCELYVRALTAGMNELERLKLKTEKETEARATEKTLSAWLTQVGGLLSASARLQYECTLTAFSIHPSPHMYERIRNAPTLPTIAALDIQEPKNESESSEFGSWANDSRAQTNFVKTSEHLKLKQSQNHANVLSTAILNEGETIGLEPDLCQDLAVLLSGPRVKTLSWDMDRETLLENCRQYMERTNCGTRALTTELKYLNLDYSQYQHLPEEQDDTHIYYGIEKGYEHLVEFEPDPEQIWQTATEEQTDTEVSSDDSEKIVRRRKKKKPKKPRSSEDDSDPLSLVAEAKKKSKKVRPHSKERSQDTEGKVRIRKPKKTEVDKEANGERSLTVENGEKKVKKPRKPRKKKEVVEVLAETSQSSLSSFVGVKVTNLSSVTGLFNEEDSKKLEKNKKEFKKERRRSKKVSKSAVNSNRAGQIDSSIYAQGITFPDPHLGIDGLYSMDEIKSPEKRLSADGNYRSNESLSTADSVNNINKITPNYNENMNAYNYYSGLKRSDLEKSVITTNYTVSNQVKNSINNLLSFRRQKAQNKEMELRRLQQQTNTYKNLQPKPSTVTSIQINKTQKQQIQALAQEVNNLMNINQNNKRTNQPIDNATNNRLLQLNNEISMLKSYDKKKQQVVRDQSTANKPCDQSTANKPCDQNTANKPVASCSSDVQTSNFSVLNQPQQKLSDHQMSFEQFLKDLHTSLNAGAKVDPSREKSVIKNEIPQRKIKLPETIVKRSEVVAPQCAKIQQKKVENAPNTFSRLSYMHKNKQADSKIKQHAITLHQLDDCKLSKVKYLQMKGEVNISRVPNTYECPKKPVPNSELTIIKTQTNKPSIPRLQLSKSNPLLAQTLATPAQTNTRTNQSQNVSASSSELNYSTIMTDEDQAELLLLLRQQSKLNSSIQKSVKRLSQPPNVIPANSKVITERLYPEVTHDNLYNIQAMKSQIVQNQSNFDTQANYNQILTKPSVICQNDTQQSVSHTEKSIKMATHDDKQDWASVMNEILSHKTPYRGPNALNMALSKKPTAQYNPPQINPFKIKTDNTKSVIKQTSTVTNENDKNIQILQNKVLQCSDLQVKKVQPRKAIQITSQTVIKPANTQCPKIKDIPVKRPSMPDQVQTANTSSEYDLLDELLDDDLRKEIGELSSDEDTYTHSHKFKTVPIPDSSCARAVVHEKKPRTVQTGVKVKKAVAKPVKNTANTSVPSSSKINVPSLHKTNTVPGLSLAVQNAIIMRKSHVQSDNTVVVQSEIYNPIKIQNNQMNVSNTKSFYYTPTPQLVQNVVVMNPGIVYDQYVQIPQNTAVCVNNTYGTINSTPDLTLYQTTQFTAPVINPIVIGNAMTSQDINMVQFNNLNQLNNANPTTETVSEQSMAKETTPYNAKAIESIQKTQLESKNTNLDINCNKSNERKVLSQVQEKLTNEKKEIKTNIEEKQFTLPEKTNKSVTIERPNELDEERIKCNQERIKNKRSNIINREINHRCHYPTIPLGYESLKNLILDIPETEVNNTGDTIEQQNTKENDEEKALPACRRILLRSSNNLKQKLVLLTPTKPKVKRTPKLKPEVPKERKQRKTKVVKPKTKKAALPCQKVKRRASQRLVNLKDAVVKNNTEVELSTQSTKDAETKPITNVSNESQVLQGFDDIEEQLVGSKIEKIKFVNKSFTTLPDVVPVAEKTASINLCLPDKEEVLENKNSSPSKPTTVIEELSKPVILPDLQKSVELTTKENISTNENVETTEKVVNTEEDKNINNIPNEILPLEMEVTEEPAMTYSCLKETTQNLTDKSKKLVETLISTPKMTCTIKDTIIAKVTSASKNTIMNQNELKTGTGRSLLKISNYDSKLSKSSMEKNNFLSQSTHATHEVDRAVCAINQINTQDTVKNTLTLPKEKLLKKPIVIEDLSKESKEKHSKKPILNEDSRKEKLSKAPIVIDDSSTEFANGVVFTELPSFDINSRCIGIKLRNGCSYKATVRGNMAKMNLETLFKDPSMKKHLINLSNCQKYTVNIKQYNTLNSTVNIIKRTTSINKNPENLETVDLISDDEVEESPQCFKTEYGIYKVKRIDDKTFKSHQSKFAQKCVVRSRKFQYSLPITIPKPEIIVSKPPVIVSMPPIIVPKSQIIAPTLDLVKLQHDDTIQELSKALTKDLSAILDTPRPVTVSEVIEIDDSSSDGVTELESPPVESIEGFKKLLIEDLFSNEESDEVNNLPSTKNCHVPIARCDDLVEEILKKRLNSDESSNEELSSLCSSPKSEISRCGSISILNDFTEFEMESSNFECDFSNYWSSPVMEVYETIVSLKNKTLDQVITDIEVDRNSLCNAEWFITKVKLNKQDICKNLRTIYSSETKPDSSKTEPDSNQSSSSRTSDISESKIIKYPVPSLTNIVLKVFENNPIIYFSRPVHAKEYLEVHTSALALNLKRKNLAPSNSVKNKITKIVKCDMKLSSDLNIRHERTVSKTMSTIENYEHQPQIIEEKSKEKMGEEIIDAQVSLTQQTETIPEAVSTEFNSEKIRLDLALQLSIKDKTLHVLKNMENIVSEEVHCLLTEMKPETTFLSNTLNDNPSAPCVESLAHMESCNITEDGFSLAKNETDSFLESTQDFESSDRNTHNPTELTKINHFLLNDEGPETPINDLNDDIHKNLQKDENFDISLNAVHIKSELVSEQSKCNLPYSENNTVIVVEIEGQTESISKNDMDAGLCNENVIVTPSKSESVVIDLPNEDNDKNIISTNTNKELIAAIIDLSDQISQDRKNNSFDVNVEVQSLNSDDNEDSNFNLDYDGLKGIEHKEPLIKKSNVFTPTAESNSDGLDSDICEKDQVTPLYESSEELNLIVRLPKITYSKESRKRRRYVRDVKIPEKRYRKGKNIDYPKFTSATMRESAYVLEFKRLIQYYDAVDFSYSRPYHKECINVDKLIKDWPISKATNEITDNITENQESIPLFEDLDRNYSCSSRLDPMAQSLDEEISANYNEIETPGDSMREINFEMGFGEGSDRVIQNLKSKDNILIYSAATLSDVKQSQPFLLSEDYEKCKHTYKNTAKIDDQIQKLRRHSNYLTLRQKIRTFFEKTTAELNESKYSSKEKGKNTRILHDLCDLAYIEPYTRETVVQVVQVGQLPVSAAAQNPVTCDPRVTQVSDASPSQCSVENSPRDDSQSGNKTEYTELTTADLTLPLVQEYAQQNQNTSMETQESASMSMTDQNIHIETEVKSNESKEDSMENEELQNSQAKKELPSLDNSSINNIEYSFDSNNTSDSLESDPHIQIMLNSAQQPTVQDPFLQTRQQNGEKTDQIAHAMNAAGITTSEPTSNTRTHALVNILSQKIRQGAVSTSQTSTTTNFTKTSINAMALQQALAQILPPPLNQTSSADNNQQPANSSVTSQVLHIVQGKNSSGNQITLVDNSQQSVISNTNATQVLHIVQNKNVTSGQTSNGTAPQQTNAFSGLSLVDTGLQQGGNQLLHIVNTGNQKNANASQLLKRVNLLTNLTSVQGSNEQKMVQFVCKSADGKAIQLNAPHQRSMVLRLQPIETPNVHNSPLTPKPTETQGIDSNANATNSSSSKESASSQEIKSRSVYEENYAKFIQNSSAKPAALEKSTSLPKFNQAFGKPVFQEGSQKPNDLNSNNSHIPPVNSNTENNESQPLENSINLDHIRQISSPPLLLRKSPAQTTQAQQNLVQQLKQTIAPMNIQTMHGGVIYTRQIPVNIGGGQTINLITVPSTELIDDSNQKSSDVKFVNQGDIEQSIIKIVPQTQTTTNADGSQEEGNNQAGSNDSTPTTQPQPVLTQMRIKLPMLSKTPQMVPGARVVRPSFFQIQRNVIGGANQPVYQQLVLTAAPPLGQQTIRLPQAQPTRPVKVPSESQSSSESQMSSSTLEQLREFDMVLEQVKERSTVQPNNSTNNFTKLLTTSTDTTDSVATASSNITETTQQVLYSIGGNQSLNVAYVNRKITTVQAPTTSSYVRSPDSSGISDSPTSSTHTNIPHTLTSDASSSDAPAQPKPAKVGSKTKSRPKASSNPPNTLKLPTPAPKTSAQKPLEDEQTTQRILYILAEYKEQVENSPDKDKPAPRRRSNPPSNPSGSSKRKKSSSGSRRSGRDMSPVHGEDTCRTMGSEDSSCGTSQGDCAESCLENNSPQDSPRKVARKLTFEQETTPPAQQPRPQPQRNVIVADGQTITVARGTAGKPATAVIMPANYILPVSVMKGGQQIAIVTNRGPKLLTVGGGEGGTTNALLLQRLIGPAGLKPVLTRPGVRHVRLPTTALHNLQAFNIATTANVQPPDSTASPAPAPTPELIETQAVSSPWADRTEQDPKRSASPEASEPWNLPSDSHEYSYEETVRADNMDRTVLDQIPDRYSPDMEAQRIFDKMFDVESKKSYIVDSHDGSPRCAYDIDASDCDDKPYQQVVQKKDSSSQRQTRLTHVSAAALRHKYAILEHELRLQKSLSEECEDLGVDSPSASELFPEAELLFAASPAHDHSQHEHTAQPTLMNQSCIPQPDIDDQIATDELIRRTSDVPDDINEDVNLGLEDVGIVTVSEDGMQATIALDQEEFARSHPNTTFHSEPTDGEVQPFSLAGLKGRQITSTIFHSNSAPATVLMTAPQATVISQVTTENAQDAVKYPDIDMMNSLPSSHGNDINLSSVLVKDDGLTRFDNILNDSRELHLSNTASAIVHSAGNATQVIRRVYGEDKRDRERFLMDETDGMMAGDDPKTMSEDSSREATLESMADVDDDDSSPERHAELFWESNSASERSESRRPLDFSSDSEKCCKSPSFDETNSTDSSGHMRLDSVIKEARGSEELGLRTYPVRRAYSGIEESLSGKTRAGERSPDSGEVRRRASARGVVKRPCHCCNGSPAPQRPKKSRQRKPTLDFTTTD